MTGFSFEPAIEYDLPLFASDLVSGDDEWIVSARSADNKRIVIRSGDSPEGSLDIAYALLVAHDCGDRAIVLSAVAETFNETVDHGDGSLSAREGQQVCTLQRGLLLAAWVAKSGDVVERWYGIRRAGTTIELEPTSGPADWCLPDDITDILTRAQSPDENERIQAAMDAQAISTGPLIPN